MSAIILLRFLIHLRILSWTSAKIWLFCKLKHQLVGLGLQMCQMWDGISCAVSLCMKHNAYSYETLRLKSCASFRRVFRFLITSKLTFPTSLAMFYSWCWRSCRLFLVFSTVSTLQWIWLSIIFKFFIQFLLISNFLLFFSFSNS